MSGTRPTPQLLTHRQIRRIEELPLDHKVLSTNHGAPIVRRPDGALLRVQPDGRLAATMSVERVQSYLDVHG
jgi:hypothetical protein